MTKTRRPYTKKSVDLLSRLSFRDMDAFAVKEEEMKEMKVEEEEVEEEEEEEHETLSSDRFPQFQYSIIAGLGGVVIGTAVGWNSPATELLSTNGDAAAAATGDGDPAVWTTAGYYCLGAAAGGLIQRPVAKCVGYRWSAVACDALVLIGWLSLLRVDSDCRWSVAAGRLVQGLGAGGLGLLVPTYISHIADVDVRGRAQMFHQAFVCFGVFHSYAFGAITTYAVLISVCMVWPVFHLSVTVLFSPESPCFLYARDDHETLMTVMRRIKGAGSDVRSDCEQLGMYMRGFASAISDFAPAENATVKNRRRDAFVIGAGLVMFQQLCGVNFCALHMEHVLKEFGSIGDKSGKIQTVVLGVSLLQVLLCLIPMELVEFLGRKCMLITSAVGMCSSMSTICYVVSIKDVGYDGTEWRNNMIIILVVLYVCSYSVGWGPVVMLLYTEIVHYDKWYSNLIYAGGQLVIFAMVYTFFNAHAPLNGTYISCASVSLSIVSIVFVYYFVPETRGLHLNQIQNVLDKGVRERDDLRLRAVKIDK